MKRRSFIKNTSIPLIGTGLSSHAYAASPQKKQTVRVSTTVEQQNIRFYADVIDQSVRVVHIADTHLSKDDERGVPYQSYSARMAKAYKQTRHFKTRKKCTPEIAFEETLAYAKNVRADVLTLVGDLFSFPSEAAIEWVLAKLKDTGIPYIYTAGNHDWHYEGMEGSLETLRMDWIKKRLWPLYQGRHPLMAAYDINGIRFLAIDNSTYQINNEQLAFFNRHVASGIPLVLLVHIPMYAPGQGILFGCANPNWSAATDRNFLLERRPSWPVQGHTQTTYNFHKKVFSAPNLLGVFAGHTHRSSLELIQGKPQIVTNDNASGAYLDINFKPMNERDKKLIS